MEMIEKRKKGCLLGLAIGDAMGAPVEFMERGSFSEQLAGACYGMDSIPKQWVDRLGNLELVDGVFGRLALKTKEDSDNINR